MVFVIFKQILCLPLFSELTDGSEQVFSPDPRYLLVHAIDDGNKGVVVLESSCPLIYGERPWSQSCFLMVLLILLRKSSRLFCLVSFVRLSDGFASTQPAGNTTTHNQSKSFLACSFIAVRIFQLRQWSIFNQGAGDRRWYTPSLQISMING